MASVSHAVSGLHTQAPSKHSAHSCVAVCTCMLLQYVVEIRFVGERELGTSHTEIVDVKKCVVEVAQPGPTCPASTGECATPVCDAIAAVDASGGTVPWDSKAAVHCAGLLLL